MDFNDLKHRITFKPDEGIKHISYDPYPCESCGIILETTRRVEHRLLETPIPHWASQCRTCMNWQNPQTGKYDCTAHERNRLFRENLEKN